MTIKNAESIVRDALLSELADEHGCDVEDESTGRLLACRRCAERATRLAARLAHERLTSPPAGVRTVAEHDTERIQDAAALDRYADWCMEEVAQWHESTYPNRWDVARDRARHARERADELRRTQAFANHTSPAGSEDHG